MLYKIIVQIDKSTIPLQLRSPAADNPRARLRHLHACVERRCARRAGQSWGVRQMLSQVLR